MKWLWFSMLWFGAAGLLAPRTAALLPTGGGPYLEQKLGFQRDMVQVTYDPVAQAAAAERRRQAVHDTMARPPMDAPNYRRAMAEKHGILTAVPVTNRGANGVPVLSIGASEIPLLPAAVSRLGWTVSELLILGGLAVVLWLLGRNLWRHS